MDPRNYSFVVLQAAATQLLLEVDILLVENFFEVLNMLAVPCMYMREMGCCVKISVENS
jgi:hypothetical protein